MLDQNTFMETVKAVQEVAKTSPTPLSKEEIFQYFADMELTDTQKDLVYDFFVHAQEESVEEQEVRETGEADSKQEEKEGKNESGDFPEEEPHSAFYQMYLDDLDALPTYTREEMQQYYEKSGAGDAQAQNVVCEYWMKQMPDLAKKFVRRGILLEDLIQEGNMGLLLALPQISNKKMTVEEIEKHLCRVVEDAMHAYAAEMAGEDDGEHTILGKVTLLHEAKKMLTEELGREPSRKELADYTKVIEQEIEDILSVVKSVKAEKGIIK